MSALTEHLTDLFGEPFAVIEGRAYDEMRWQDEVASTLLIQAKHEGDTLRLVSFQGQPHSGIFRRLTKSLPDYCRQHGIKRIVVEDFIRDEGAPAAMRAHLLGIGADIEGRDVVLGPEAIRRLPEVY